MKPKQQNLTRAKFDSAPRHFEQIEANEQVHESHSRLVNGVVYDFNTPFEVVAALERARQSGERVWLQRGCTEEDFKDPSKRHAGDYPGKPSGEPDKGILEINEHPDKFPWGKCSHLVLRTRADRADYYVWEQKLVKIWTMNEVLYQHPNCENPEFYSFQYTVVSVDEKGRGSVSYVTGPNEIKVTADFRKRHPLHTVIAIFFKHSTELTGLPQKPDYCEQKKGELPHKAREFPGPYCSTLEYLKSIFEIPTLDSVLDDARALILRDIQENLEGRWNTAETLLDFRYWDLDRIRPRHRFDCKPRIRIEASITSKDNFVLRWYPQGEFRRTLNGPVNETDFDNWIHDHLDQSFYSTRPVNELMYIRDVYRLKRFDGEPLSFVDHCLVHALKACVKSWITTLRQKFEVTEVDEFEIEYNEEERVIGWKIVNLEERRQEEKAKWCAEFESRYTLKLETILKYYHGVRGVNKADGIIRAMKKDSIDADKKAIREIVKTLEGRYPELLSESKPTDSQTKGSSAE